MLTSIFIVTFMKSLQTAILEYAMPQSLKAKKNYLACVTFLAFFGLLPTLSFAVELLNNGGFETGNFSGWNQVTSNGSSRIDGCNTDWTVKSTDDICNYTSTVLNNPIEGDFAAFNSFDGDGPQSFIIEQDISLGAGNIANAELSWLYSIGWNFGLGDPRAQERIFSLEFQDSLDNLIGRVFEIKIDTNDGMIGLIDWTSQTTDVTGLLQGFEGQTVTLVAEAFIPESFTGPATLGFDNVSLNITTIENAAITDVPEPSVLALFLAGLLGLRKISAKSPNRLESK